MECLCNLLSLVEEILKGGKDALRMLLDSVEAILRIGLDVTASDADHADAHLRQISAKSSELVLQVNDKGAMIAYKGDEQAIFQLDIVLGDGVTGEGLGQGEGRKGGPEWQHC